MRYINLRFTYFYLLYCIEKQPSTTADDGCSHLNFKHRIYLLEEVRRTL